MGLGSLVLTQEQQRFKEFLPEISPERAAYPPFFPQAAVAFQLEVIRRQLHGELTAEIVSPCQSNTRTGSLLCLHPEAHTVP
ncbi:hypothetical protein GJAV_G00246030 [Gymnothorax javanicus]|nr:hypothetical protein GJAV_G00246030 [Gymnothorax javanicus]